MGRLIIEREQAPWMDKLRAYSVEVDGTVRGKVDNGETVEVVLAPGPHRVRMKIDWCGSREIVVDGSANTRLRCRPGTRSFTAIFYILFWRNDYIRLEKAD